MRTTIILILLSLSTIAYSQDQQSYEYLSMTQFGNEIFLNKDSESFEIIYVKNEKVKYSQDYRPILKRIEEYEKQGWEIVSNNVYVSDQVSQNYVLMKRKK